MFAVKDIKRALRWIFSLYDEEEISYLLDEDEDDVVSALMTEELSRKFRREARNITMFCSCWGPKDKGTWSGPILFKKKAAPLYALTMESNAVGNLRVQSVSELWLLSDMQFAVVHCVRAFVLRKNKPTSVTYCRTFVKYIRKASDLPVDAYTLFCELDKTGLMEQLSREKNAPCDF